MLASSMVRAFASTANAPRILSNGGNVKVAAGLIMLRYDYSGLAFIGVFAENVGEA